MRLGVLDVGSNTIHLLVVDAHAGAHPLPAAAKKTELRLSEIVGDDGRIGREGENRLVDAVADARAAADELGVEDFTAFATSAMRDAANSEDLLARIDKEIGVNLHVIDGEEEARLTFLAARRWHGWSAGRLLVMDIGGGSLEIAAGIDEDPAAAVSLPLGAGRLTRERLRGDPPDRDDIADLRRHVRATIARDLRAVNLAGAPDLAVATSKTFRSLARIAGAAPYSAGPYARRELSLPQISEVLKKVSSMTVAERARLPGVSAERAPQLVAGALVAEAVFDLLHVDAGVLCPWALREGVILRRLDHLADD